MNPDLRRLFDAVSELPINEQRAALAALTQDAPLIDQVLRICGHAQTNDTAIFSAISSSANDLTAMLSNELKAGDTLDTWKLIEKIGQGGMGSVFLAERADGHFQQTVAVKVMHGLPTPNATARLAQERQILAGLTHPNIARLFDGGATPNGQPYLVLEYIAGLTIDAFCRTKKLDFLQILELLLPVCDAVAIAHQRLIIHCDIKPSNILVSQAGRPSLLDFGIASLAGEADLHSSLQLDVEGEALSRHDGEPTEHFTQTTMRGSIAVAYTPRYASPEQKASKPISTATDIYSLGRVIEELCDLDSAFKLGEVRGKARLQMQEVQAIIDKACANIPAARYGSAQALAADIKNALRGARVEAAVEAATAVPNYISRKWFSQHWLQVAAACLVLAIIAGFTLKVIAEKNQAQWQAAKAEAERLTATQARAAAEAAQIETQVAKNDALKQRDTAEGARTMAEGARSMAEDARKQALLAQGNAVEAQRKAQTSQQQAEQERKLAVAANKSTDTANEFLVSIFQSVNPSYGGDRNATARDLVANAEKRLGELKDIPPETLAKLYTSIGDMHMAIGNVLPGVEYHLKAAEAWGISGDKFFEDRVGILIVAAVQLSARDLARSRQLSKQAFALAAKKRKELPSLYASAVNAVFVGLQAGGQYVEAKALIPEVILHHKLAGNVDWQSDSFISFNANMARNQFNRGDYAAAETTYRVVIEAKAKRVPILEASYVDAFTGLGRALAKLGRQAEAEVEFKRAMDRCELKFGAESPQMLRLRGTYGGFLTDLKRFDEAQVQYKLAEETAIKFNVGGSYVTTQLVNQAQLADVRGQVAQAIALRERLAAIYIDTRCDASGSSGGSRGSYSSACYQHIARNYADLKRFDEARSYADRALALHKGGSTQPSTDMLNAQRAMAYVELADGKPSAAIAILERVMALDLTVPDVLADDQYTTRRDAALAWQAVAAADVLAGQSAHAKALSYAEAARDVAEKSASNLSDNYLAAVRLIARLNEEGRSNVVKQ